MNEINYQQDAQDRLARCGGKLTLELSDTKPIPFADEDDEPIYRPHYICTLTGPGGEYVFDFWDSIKSGEDSTPATVYDVMSCLDWACPESFEEFCSEFGYDNDSIKASKIWEGCLVQTRNLHRVFPSEEAQTCLAEIC